MSKPDWWYRYRGMSYEQASREADRLTVDGWFKNFDRLQELHRTMVRQRSLSRESMVG